MSSFLPGTRTALLEQRLLYPTVSASAALPCPQCNKRLHSFSPNPTTVSNWVPSLNPPPPPDSCRPTEYTPVWTGSAFPNPPFSLITNVTVMMINGLALPVRAIGYWIMNWRCSHCSPSPSNKHRVNGTRIPFLTRTHTHPRRLVLQKHYNQQRAKPSKFFFVRAKINTASYQTTFVLFLVRTW